MSEPWDRTTLGAVADAVTASLQPGSSGSLPYVALEHITPDNPRIARAGVSSDTVSNTTLFEAGDVLFSKLRPYLNKVAVAEAPGSCTGEILVFRAKVGAPILSGYLALLLRDSRAVQFAVDMSAGTRMPRTSSTIMKGLPVSLPPLPEQRRIVDLIAALDEAIEAAEASRAAARKSIAELASEASVQSATGLWEMSTLGTVIGEAGAIQTGPFGSQLHQHDYVPAGVPVLMPANMRDGRVVREGMSYVNDIDASRLNRHRLQAGDIAWSRRGDVTRFAAIGPEEEGMIAGTGCLLVRFSDSSLTDWMSVWLSTPTVGDWLTDHAVGATMANLNTGILSGVPVALPPRDARPAFIGGISGLAEFAGASKELSESLRSLRTELLAACLSGEHEIPASYDQIMTEAAA